MNLEHHLTADIRTAFAFLTVIPVGSTTLDSQPGRAFAYFPLVGLIIGLMLRVCINFQFLPSDLMAFITLLLWIIVTGGLHLDGLADAADGLIATTTPERRLEIMKDPRRGTWALVAIAVIILGKWLALRSITPALIILPPLMGRWSMTLAAYRFADARKSGLGASFRDGLGWPQIFVATGITILAAMVFGGGHGVLLFSLTPIFVLIFGTWASQRLGGGVTGDVYGACCELVELLCLIVLNIF